MMFPYLISERFYQWWSGCCNNWGTRLTKAILSHRSIPRRQDEFFYSLGTEWLAITLLGTTWFIKKWIIVVAWGKLPLWRTYDSPTLLKTWMRKPNCKDFLPPTISGAILQKWSRQKLLYVLFHIQAALTRMTGFEFGMCAFLSHLHMVCEYIPCQRADNI